MPIVIEKTWQDWRLKLNSDHLKLRMQKGNYNMQYMVSFLPYYNSTDRLRIYWEACENMQQEMQKQLHGTFLIHLSGPL